ncbi:MAG: hypothetical protein LQ342_007514 [Letrouitia transgressa]|nr:MAG: hypothetical protein LQ342_007514 [Letrouitia transgressa]
MPAAPATATPNSQASGDTSAPGSKSKRSASSKDGKQPRGRRERPCDACRKRKSRCVVNEGSTVCAACAVHGQQCTYVEDPQPRKRRLDNDGKEIDSAKRRSTLESHTINAAEVKAAIKHEKESATWIDANGVERPRSELLLGNPQHYGTHIGYTTELEPLLFDIAKAAGKPTQTTGYQKPDPRNAFLVKKSDDEMQEDAESEALLLIEGLVGAHGPFLIQNFRDNSNRSFPIIEQPFLQAYERRQSSPLEPGLLAAMYTVAASSPIYGFPNASQLHIDIPQLEEIAFRWFENSLAKPTLSTIQAGILLMQRPNVDTKTLNSQLVSAAYELGLHLDCTSWLLTDQECGLRKTLAWALYMQDKWCSLIHGRPSLISKDHWGVKGLVEKDCAADYVDLKDAAKEEAQRGRELFNQMVTLTRILGTVLETFYTLKSMQEVEDAGEGGTRVILDKAKPVQIQLKEWFSKLPKSTKVDSAALSGKPTSTGHLHLAYFATEITLHRCIIRSLNATNKDTYLSHVCRSAAKTRLISAMDFVNRLRPEHLSAFWYFPSKVNFALIGVFGGLLLASAPCQEEADFYRTRLAEFRWTLCVSSRNAPFLTFAVESLDSSLNLLQGLPQKPSTLDVTKQMPAPNTSKSTTQYKPLPKIPPKPLQRPSPPQDDQLLDSSTRSTVLHRNPSSSGNARSTSAIRPQHSGTSLASASGLVSPAISRTSSDSAFLDFNPHGSRESLHTGYNSSQHSGSATHSAQHSVSDAGGGGGGGRSVSRMNDPAKMLSRISEARSSMIRDQEAMSIHRNSQRSSSHRPSELLQRQDSWAVPPHYDQPTQRSGSSQMQYGMGGGSQYGDGSVGGGFDSYYGGASQLGGYADMSAYGADMSGLGSTASGAGGGGQAQGRMWFIEGLHDDHSRMA